MPNGAVFHLDLAADTLKAGQAHAASDYRARAGADAGRGGHVAGGFVGWSGERSALWDAAETAETPKRQRVAEVDRKRERAVARSLVIALPDALPPAERERLTRGMALWLRDRHGVAVQWDVHAPDPQGDHRNHHAHLLLTTRQVDAAGAFGAKTRELSSSTTSSAHITAWREEWAKRTNRALERHGSTTRVDHRSKAAVAAETGTIPVPPRPRTPLAEYVQVRAEDGTPPPPPIAYSRARQAAEAAEDLRQQALAAATAVKAEESVIERLQARAADYMRRLMEQARDLAQRRQRAPQQRPGSRNGPVL